MIKDVGNKELNKLIEAIKICVKEKKYSWRELESMAPPTRIIPTTSMFRKDIPDLLVFEPKPGRVAVSQQVLPDPNLIDDSTKYFGDSKTLRTPAHRNIVMKFVRDQYPKAKFKRIYDATTDGWNADDFHRCCNKKRLNLFNNIWTLSIVETTKDFIFGGFTTAEWESPPPS
jgi:hypothetical protein